MWHRGRFTVIGCAIGVIASAAPAHSQPSGVSGDLDRIRAGLAKYQDPVAAVHDGYFSTLGCVEFSKAGGPGQVPYKPGGMGVHFFNTALIGPIPDPNHPQVLIYEPDGEKLRLVAAEWFIPLATGVKGRPELFGHPFDGPMAGHHPLMPADMNHWDLHVWLFKRNPLGIFSPTNPDIKCGQRAYTMREEAPQLVAVPQP